MTDEGGAHSWRGREGQWEDECADLLRMNRTICDAARCRDLLTRFPRARRVVRAGGGYTYILSGSAGGVAVGFVELYRKSFLWEIDVAPVRQKAGQRFVFRLREVHAQDDGHSLRFGDPGAILEGQTPEEAVLKAQPAGSRTRYAAPGVFAIGDWDKREQRSDALARKYDHAAAAVPPTTPSHRRTPSGDVQPAPVAGGGALAAALFSAGVTYSQACAVEVATDATPLMSRTAFYAVEQPAVMARARDKRNDLLDERTASLKGREITIQLDGTWSHRRNAPEATVLCFDADTDVLIDLQHLVKMRKGDLHSHVDGLDKRLVRYRGASKTMEGEGVSYIMKRLRDAGVRVGAVVKDDDSTAMAAVHEYFPKARVRSVGRVTCAEPGSTLTAWAAAKSSS